MKDFLAQEFWGNTVSDYAVAAGLFIVSLFVIHLLKILVFNRLRRSDDEANILSYKFLIKSISSFVVPLLYLGALYLAMRYIETNETISNVVKVIYLLIIVWIAIKFARAVIEFVVTKYSKGGEKEDDLRRFRPLLAFVNFALYIIGVLFILDNLGFEITTVVAGLGIGGIAIALAAQTILGDLFSYFVIYFDKPFELGDFIIFDDKIGAIEKIGIKSTRVRTLRGELLIVSNSNLTNARVHNFKKMLRRRVLFTIGVTYQTKAAELEEIPKIIKRIIEEANNTTFDRSHFFNYGAYSLDFETVYYVGTSDYNEYMDVQQEINLKIYKEFEERGIEFAYPTRTVYNVPIKEE